MPWLLLAGLLLGGGALGGGLAVNTLGNKAEGFGQAKGVGMEKIIVAVVLYFMAKKGGFV